MLVAEVHQAREVDLMCAAVDIQDEVFRPVHVSIDRPDCLQGLAGQRHVELRLGFLNAVLALEGTGGAQGIEISKVHEFA